jgi:hypothetical protein
MKRMGFLSIALATVVAVGCDGNHKEIAQTATAGDPAPVGTAGEAANKVSSGDKDFVNDLAVAGMAEVELGRMATQQAASAEVKKFGQMMIDDHTKAGDTPGATPCNILLRPPGREARRPARQAREARARIVEYMAAMAEGPQTVAGKLESGSTDRPRRKTEAADVSRQEDGRAPSRRDPSREERRRVTMSLNSGRRRARWCRRIEAAKGQQGRNG